MTRSSWLVVCVALFCTSTAFADPPARRARHRVGPESSAELGNPRIPLSVEHRASNGDTNAIRAARLAARPWRGPRIELGYVHYSLSDSNGGGPVNGVSIGGYLATGYARLGILGDAGSRRYSFDENDLALRVSAVAGYQAISAVPFLPFLVARLDWGVLIQQRFNTTLADGIYGIGLEAGIEINPGRSFHFGVSVGVSYIDIHDLSFASFSLRAFLGL